MLDHVNLTFFLSILIRYIFGIVYDKLKLLINKLLIWVKLKLNHLQIECL